MYMCMHPQCPGGTAQTAGTKASSHFKGPIKSFTILGMEIRNASMAFEAPFLAVGIFGSGGTLKLSLPDIPLKGGDNKVQMRFDIGAKASVPDEHDSVCVCSCVYVHVCVCVCVRVCVFVCV